MLSMPRYFFHIDDHPSERDTEGVDLEDDAAARQEALGYLAQIVEDDIIGISPHHLPLRVRVKDDHGRPVTCFTILETTENERVEGLDA
jgi:hypothetical protein